MKGSAAYPYWPRVLRREKAAAYLDLSISLFDREVSDGHLPPPVAITATVKGWVREDLDAWIDGRRAAQDAAPNPWDEAS
jgi:predicted DNA-binding transcriptional regulator AlpA